MSATKENFYKKPSFYIMTFLVSLSAGVIFFNLYFVGIETYGKSMEPVITEGDKLICERYNFWNDPDDIEVGEIVVNELHTVHRVIHKEGNRIITKGDNNNQSDKAITDKQIIAHKCEHFHVARLFHV